VIDLQILGPLTVTGSDGESLLLRPRQRALLTMFLLRPRKPWARDALAPVLWAGRPPVRPQDATKQAVSRLRRTLGRGGIPRATITSAGGGYLADPPAGALDLDRYQAALSLARQAHASGDAARAVLLLQQALDSWTDPGWEFRDAPDLPAVQGLIAALDEERRAAEDQLVDMQLAQGGHARLLPSLQARSRKVPGDEGACARLMRALLADGREVEAAGAFHRTAQALSDELGVRPGPALRDLLSTALRDL
jgi:DNA-binding SARP family transcriptional activator